MNTELIYLTIAMRSIALIVIIFTVLPIQYKEAQVENGLGFFRKSIFFGICLYTLVTIELLIYNIYRLTHENYQLFMDISSVFNSASNLIIAVVLYLIYHRHHTLKGKDGDKHGK